MSRKPPLTYHQYCIALASMQLPANKVQAFNLPGPLAKFVAGLKGQLQEMAELVGVGLRDLIRALMNKDAFALLKALRFNLMLVVKGMRALLGIVPRGLAALFRELRDSRVLALIQQGALSADEFFEAHPIIKKISGPVLAALLFWMWTQSMFIGDPWTDLDMSTIGAALTGHYSFQDLFTTPEGLAGLALFAGGILLPGIGVAWLGSNSANVVLALMFTVARKALPSLAVRLKTAIPKSRPFTGV